jgi:modification methylase
MRSQPAESVDTIVTSPPYNKKGLRGGVITSDKGWKGANINYNVYADQMPEAEYQQWQIDVLNECYRLIRPTGSIFYNHKIRNWQRKGYHPWQWLSKIDAQFYQEIIWWRKNTIALDQRYLFTTTERVYWFCKGKPAVYKDHLPAEYRSDVWHITPDMRNSHPAPFPAQLAENCVLLTTLPGNIVYDPFTGSGTVAMVCDRLNRRFVGTEIDSEYVELTQERLNAAE